MLAILVFGATLALSMWTLWATLQPQARRIVDLLVHGPVAVSMLPAPVPARSNLRNVRVRSVTRVGRVPLRAAA